MAKLTKLKNQYMLKEITEEEYKKHLDAYMRKLFDLYCNDLLTEEEFRKLTKE